MATIVDLKIRCLANYLNVDHCIFRPVVVFNGDCKFKSSMPVNAMQFGVDRRKIRELKDLAGLTTDARLDRSLPVFEPATILRRGRTENLREDETRSSQLSPSAINSAHNKLNCASSGFISAKRTPTPRSRTGLLVRAKASARSVR